MPLRERRENVQTAKIRINDRERSISFKSTQDLVDKVLEYYVAEVQGDGVLVEKYLMDGLKVTRN